MALPLGFSGPAYRIQWLSNAVIITCKNVVIYDVINVIINVVIKGRFLLNIGALVGGVP